MPRSTAPMRHAKTIRAVSAVFILLFPHAFLVYRTLCEQSRKIYTGTSPLWPHDLWLIPLFRQVIPLEVVGHRKVHLKPLVATIERLLQCGTEDNRNTR